MNPEPHKGTFYILYDGEVPRHANAFGSVFVIEAYSIIQVQDGPSMTPSLRPACQGHSQL